jgi:hypothetical protein
MAGDGGATGVVEPGAADQLPHGHVLSLVPDQLAARLVHGLLKASIR